MARVDRQHFQYPSNSMYEERDRLEEQHNHQQEYHTLAKEVSIQKYLLDEKTS